MTMAAYIDISDNLVAKELDLYIFETLCKLGQCSHMFWPTVGWCEDFANKMNELVEWYIKEDKIDKGLENVSEAIEFIYYQRRNLYRGIRYRYLRKCTLNQCKLLLRANKYDECLQTCEKQIVHLEEKQPSDFRVYLAYSLLRLGRYDECVQELKHLDLRFYGADKMVQEIIEDLKNHVDASEFEVAKGEDLDYNWIPTGQLKCARANPTKTAKKKSRSRRAGKTRRVAVPSSPLATKPQSGVRRAFKSTHDEVGTSRRKAVEIRNKAHILNDVADKTKPQSEARSSSIKSTHNVDGQQRRSVGSRKKTQSMAKSKAAKSEIGARRKKAIETETLKGGQSNLMTSKTPPSKTSSKTLWCSYCKETLNTDIEVELHVIGVQHKVKVNSDNDREWRQRKPPLNAINGDYKMCERSSPCERGKYCTRAHNEDEFNEWKERYKYRMKKIRQSLQELSSVMDRIAYDYNFDNSLLKDNIDGVECKENGEVDRKIFATERINNKFTCTFEFIIKCTGEKKLRCVCLLHDEHRDNFYFTQPSEENKPQICPGNKLIDDDYVTCRVSVKFVSFSAGHFDQWVIFDLGQKLYMKRTISVHAGLQKDVDTPIDYDSLQLKSLPWEDVIPFEDKPEFQKRLLNNAKSFKPKTTDDKLLKEKLSENNYTMMMHRFIDIEEREQQTIIEKFNLKTKIAISKKMLTDSTWASNLIVAQGDELFGKINLKKAIDFDSLAGTLILDSVNSVACRFYSNPTMAFEAKICKDGTDDSRTEEYVYVLFNDRCVSENNLKDGSEHEAEVKFLIDRIPFVEMHFAIQNLKSMHCVWPKKSEQLRIFQNNSTELDKYQETAARFICSKEIQHDQAPLVICGPFGTGKTRVLAKSVKRILEQSDDSRVLICTMSNSAADLYITDGIREESDRFIKENNACKILRVYQPNRRISTIPKRVRMHCLFEIESKLRVPNRDDIEKAKVVICTLTTAIYMIPLNVKGSFTHILIDEAGQALEPQTIMPLALANEKTCVVLAGDHLQMSPKIYSKSSKDANFHISLLERLKKMKMANSILLRRNYRTCRPILEFLSTSIYEKGIECAIYEKFNPDFPAMSLVEVKGLDTKQGASYVNKEESTELVERVKNLHDQWPENFGEKDIAVVTSYQAQVSLIRNLLRKRGMKEIVVERVRNIQAVRMTICAPAQCAHQQYVSTDMMNNIMCIRDRFRVIFVSTVRTRKTLNLVEMTAIKGTDFISTHKYGFLSDVKLLNTAFTRAKSMVVVVGDPVALCSAGECCMFWTEYVKRCEAINGISPKSLTFDKIQTEMYNNRQKLDPTAKAFEPSFLIRNVHRPVPEHTFSTNHSRLGLQHDTYRRMLAEQQREAKLNDVILRELKLGEQNEDLEENDDIQKGKSAKKKMSRNNWRKLENYDQVIEGRDIKYIPSREEGVPEHSSDYWLDVCEKTPEKYKYCTFNIDRTGNMFAIDNKTGKHICITSARRRGTAFEKDTVVVEVLRKYENNDCNDEIIYGVVKYVIERHSNPRLQAHVCKLDSRTNNLMVPLNKTLPKLAILGMEVSTYPKARFKIYKVSDDRVDEEEPLVRTGIEEVSIADRPNALFIVKYLKWYPRYTYPLGCVTKRLSPGDSLGRGLKIISLEHNVNVQGQWSESVNKEVKEGKKFNEKWRIPVTEIHDRLDFRKESVFTIDPIDANDLDDALSVKILSDGHYKVGIHISDVSYFVQRQSEIDLEAKKRCISHYPTSAKPIPMIHKNLSSNKCSLIPNEDRLTISVIFKIDEEGCPVKDGTNIVRSIVHSRNQFSYKEVEEIIHKRSNGPSENLTKQILLLNQLAIKIRETRLKSGRFCYNHDDVTDDLDCPLAHSLVEEFMLLANEAVATFLTTTFPNCVPLRRQLPPDSDKMQEWTQTFHGPIKNSLEMSAKIADLPCDSSGSMTLTKDVWNKLVRLLKIQQNKEETSRPNLRSDDEDFFEMIDLVANDMLHPQLMLMKLKYYNIQFNSDYVCSGRDDESHHSLSLSRYTHFTSPIRRYIDLVVHRLLVAALKKDNQPPYTPKEIEDICNNMNEKALNAKRFHRRTKDLVLALDLKKHGALPYQPVIDSVDDSNIYLAFPQSYINRSQSPLGFNYLKPSERVVATNEISTVTWKISLFDARDKSSLLLSMNKHELSRLDPARFLVEMESKIWQKLVDAITSGTQTDLRNALNDCMKNIHIKSKSRKEKMLVDTVNYEKFECKFQRFDVMRVHLAPELRNGMLQPTIQLVSLAENIDVCLEHRKNPVLCFSQLADENPRDSKCIERYRTTWLSVLDMCSAYGAVNEDNATIISNVEIQWQPDGSGSFTGSFKLLEEFCDFNMLRFFRKSMKKGKENQDDDTAGTRALDYLCIRYSNLQCLPRPQDSKPTHLRGKSTYVWVGHCYTTDINNIVESNKTYLMIQLELNQSAIPLPLVQIRKQEALCTVELIPKSPPDRRTEAAVLALGPCRSETSLARCIVLQQNIISNRVIEGEVLIRESLNRNCRNWKIHSIPRCHNVSSLPPPNFPQINAIEKAISQTFTVIQGPPGTGKSVTGSQLAFFFAQINKRVEAINRPQVLYCGPSNKSVEVVAGYLKRLSDIRVVRVYSESIEDKDYPRPWLAKPKRKFSMMEASIDPKNRDIALHHLIRQRGNPFSCTIERKEAEFTKRIEEYRRKAKSKKSNDKYDAQAKKLFTEEEIKAYKALIMDAKKEELQKYDVILTTCNVAGAPEIRRFCNIIECIIDEAGMCTEPESLIPLVGCTPHKVVFIGDHKQLRPIVQEPNARELGMEISLLERYADEAIMLDIQYRMHPSICDFPSQQFYDNKLKTDISVSKRKPDTLKWPRDGNKEYHTLFCHVDGKEESQTVKTEEGNENSKCNQQELECLMKVVWKLLEKRIVAKDILVLTQYRLQLSEIKTKLNKDSRTREVRAATVITSQGSESDYVIMSTVRSIPLVQIEEKPTIGWKKKCLGFIIDENQTNVAITRAKRGLILIGNKNLLETHETWRNLIKSYEDRGCLMYNMDFMTNF
ncbi:helicase with zinc finger domain 2-like [Anneissia japonica]|uniref:helicase with zinc finger domain 2-like n=1 Tax=Anneissia japonica TaxID=1529436 RepID=UPI001425A199|nr:helicase with zinc finger domain 2-like [Anneissia japonica]